MKDRFRATVAGVLGCAVVSAASTPTVKSQVLSDAIRVDGSINDWPTLTALTKELSVAAANDGDRLCLAIATSDPHVKQELLAAGLIVYLDPQGKKGETFGVRIPPLGGAMSRGRSGGSGGRRGGGDPTATPPPPAADAGSERSAPVTYLEVIGPVEKERHILDLVQPMGFEVASGNDAGTMLIELAIPLRKTADIPYVPPLVAGKFVVGIGLVTPEVSHTGSAPSGGSGGGGRGGMSGGRGGMGGGRGGGMPGGGPEMHGGKAIKIWTTLSLAIPQ